MAQEASGLPELWQFLREVGLQSLAPTLVRHGVRSKGEAAQKAAQLLHEGIPAWQLDLLADTPRDDGASTLRAVRDSADVPPAVPDPALAQLVNSFVSRIKPEDLILLSFFDGMGAAPLAVQLLVGTPLLAMAWETDPECIKVTTARLPHLQHRGDVLREDFSSVVRDIKKVDPQGTRTILITGGPPCPDFSKITDKTEGRHHSEGSKFVELTKILNQLETDLPDNQLIMLIENVVMADETDVNYFSEKLKAEPVVVDAADNSLVSRPRLWWTRLDWTRIKAHPLSGKPLKWSQHNSHRQLRMSLPDQDYKSLQTDGLSLHQDVMEGKRKIPCFTTPSPDEKGRAPPAKSKTRVPEEAKQRWLADARTYAPWQYTDIAMAYQHDEHKVIPPMLKEQLHSYPKGCLDDQGA
eukprot:Skav211047  [mRNA]  locus=scaffold1351:69:4364:- [translate_table: standard]